MSRDEKTPKSPSFHPGVPELPDPAETLRYIYPWFEVVFWTGRPAHGGLRDVSGSAPKGPNGSTQESSRDEIASQGASMGLTFWPKREIEGK